ncbi:MAG: hypothetical protein HPY94_05055 [Clostridia bacterium]|nr:hypothetical protein [Clostridia bacterium]
MLKPEIDYFYKEPGEVAEHLIEDISIIEKYRDLDSKEYFKIYEERAKRALPQLKALVLRLKIIPSYEKNSSFVKRYIKIMKRKKEAMKSN